MHSTFSTQKLVYREAFSAHITHMAYNLFIEENPTIVGVSEFALRPLINEQDPDIQSKGIQKIRSGVSKGQHMAYNLFIKENPTIVGVSEFALRPLINEADTDIKAEAKQKIGEGVTKKHPMEAENTDLYNIGLKAYC